MNNKSAYDDHLTALKALAVAYGNEVSPTRAKRLRALINVVRDEVFEMVTQDLENSTAAYTALTPRFQAAADSLTWVRNQIDKFVLAADQAAKLASWAVSMLAIL